MFFKVVFLASSIMNTIKQSNPAPNPSMNMACPGLMTLDGHSLPSCAAGNGNTPNPREAVTSDAADPRVVLFAFSKLRMTGAHKP